MTTDITKIVFGLYGAGGFGREVMPILRGQELVGLRPNKEISLEFLFVETNAENKIVNGSSLITENEFFNIDCQQRYFNIAISDSRVRVKIADSFIERGALPYSINSPNSIIYNNNEIGDGAIICAYSVITSNVKIGRFFHCNLYSYVAHDCVIGDYVTFAPGVKCNGNVHVNDHVYIGAGAIIKQGTRDKPLVIGEGSTIGMGAVVTKDVEPYTTVFGNPAKPYLKSLEKNDS